MNNGWYIKVIFDQGIWQLVEEKGGTSEAEGEDLIKIILTPPGHAQKFPIHWMDWNDSECWLDQVF